MALTTTTTTTTTGSSAGTGKPAMDDPVQYIKANKFQRDDANFVLEKYGKFIGERQWRKVLDVGVGPGVGLNTVGRDLVTKYLQSCGAYVGLDRSARMVEFARENCMDTRVSFEVADIEQGTGHSNADLLVSFFCLNWVKDQPAAARSISNSLVPGGKVLLCLIATNPIYNIFEAMAQMDPWKDVMADYRDYISYYHYSAKPEEELRKALEKAGVNVDLCVIETRSFTFPNIDSIYHAVKAVNPFQLGGRFYEFFRDYFGLLHNFTEVKSSPDGNTPVTMEYKILVAKGTKI